MKTWDAHFEKPSKARDLLNRLVLRLVSLPTAWAALAAVLVSVIIYLYLIGEVFSGQAFFIYTFSLFAVIGLAWSIGAKTQRDSESFLLRAAIDESYDGLLITSSDGRFVYSNSSFYRLFGIKTEASVNQIKSLEDAKKFLENEKAGLAAFQRLGATAKLGGGGREEFSINSQNGLIEWRRLSVSSVLEKGLASEGLFSLWRIEDVTAGREMDIIRHKEEAYLADFLDLLPVGFFSSDTEGCFQYVNQTFAKWLGVTTEKMIGSPLDEYMSPKVDRLGPAENAATITFTRKDGGEFSGWVAQSLHEGAGGQTIYSRCVVLRSADWLYREQKLDDSSENGSPEVRLHWLFDEAPVGILLLDLQGNIAECNLAFLNLVGLNPEDLIGHPFTNRVAKEDKGDAAAALSKVVMGTAKATHIEVRMPGAGERELVASLYASRLENALGEISGLALHFIDTTEQRNLEVQFAQSQKMDAIGQLAGGIAHDFNNLLTAMIGFADLLLTRHGPDDPSFADIQQIRQNANRATNLVRQLLAFSRKQALTLERLDVTETLNELTTLLSRLIGEKIDLNLEHGSGLGAIKFDRGQFDQIIINLAVNARDAMPGGGQLSICTSAVVLDEPAQRGHDLMGKGQYVLIEVMDTGTGIRKENIEKIFEPFFSTKEVGAGTGLGLSTVYGIVHQTNGFIFVDSAPGDGTCFSIYMPEFIKEDEKQYITKGNPDVDPSPVNPGLKNGQESDLTGSGTVLLVEDEDAVRLFGARALRNKGYKVLEAENGEGALDVINGFDKRIDLIISDVVMPGMDGHTLIRLVRHELPDVKVILMSGYAEDVFREEIDRDKSIKFLPKPFSLKTLALTVKATLES
jgi:two-component system cell cycle sensor histidine kinase/response regulator CckA